MCSTKGRNKRKVVVEARRKAKDDEGLPVVMVENGKWWVMEGRGAEQRGVLG